MPSWRCFSDPSETSVFCVPSWRRICDRAATSFASAPSWRRLFDRTAKVPPCVPSHRRSCDRADTDGSRVPPSRRFCDRAACMGSRAPSFRRSCDRAAAEGMRPGAWRSFWWRDAAFFFARTRFSAPPRRWGLLGDLVSGANLAFSSKPPSALRLCLPCNGRLFGPDQWACMVRSGNSRPYPPSLQGRRIPPGGVRRNPSSPRIAR